MSNETKKTALPKLRFPEFRNSPEWEEKSFGEVAVFLKGKGISKADVVANGALPCIRYGELYTRYNETITSVISSTNLLADDLVLSRENDVIIPASGETQEDIATASCVLKSGVALGGDLNIIRSSMDGVFLALYLTNVKKKDIAQLAQGISVVHLYSNQLKKLSIHVPPIAEQQKIAAALSSFQDLIDAEGKKLAALQAHKRGLMQGLFPAEGETVPKLRFSEFQEADEWKERKLGDVCKMQAGKFVSAAEIFNTKQDGLFPCYGGNGLRGYTKSFTHEGKYSLIGRQGALCGNITLAKDKFHATEHAVVVTPKNGIDTNWLYYQLNLSNLNQYATGQAQPGLSVENLEKVKTWIPSSELEQKMIASCLSSADSLIKTQQKRLKSLQLHKKALTQRLFPPVSLSQS